MTMCPAVSIATTASSEVRRRRAVAVSAVSLVQRRRETAAEPRLAALFWIRKFFAVFPLIKRIFQINLFQNGRLIGTRIKN